MIKTLICAWLCNALCRVQIKKHRVFIGLCMVCRVCRHFAHVRVINILHTAFKSKLLLTRAIHPAHPAHPAHLLIYKGNKKNMLAQSIAHPCTAIKY